jgi:hypothetical protein
MSSGYIVSNSTNAFSTATNALQTQLREYIRVCQETNQSLRVYRGIELHNDTLPTVVYITPREIDRDPDCGLLIAEAVGIDTEKVDLTFQMWNNECIVLENSPGKDDMFYRSKILQQMRQNATVSGKLLEIINNRRFWKQSNYKSGTEMVTYILFTRYKFVVDSSGWMPPRLKNENDGHVNILSRTNVIIFAIDLLKFFGLTTPLDIESPYNVRSDVPGKYYVKYFESSL